MNRAGATKIDPKSLRIPPKSPRIAPKSPTTNPRSQRIKNTNHPTRATSTVQKIPSNSFYRVRTMPRFPRSFFTVIGPLSFRERL